MSKKKYHKPLSQKIESIVWHNYIHNKNSYLGENKFSFLNKIYHFEKTINWSYDGYGKLWTYNLNYFDFLNQESIAKKNGLDLVKHFCKSEKALKDGKEPYPISLRGINWIKFLSINKVSNTEINQFLRNDYQNLLSNLEYHLLGNHLLENAFSLLFGAYYFRDQSLYEKAKQLVTSEINEQVLHDGGHFERSPMYHQLLLHRLLDCIQLIQLNPWKKDELLEFLIEKSALMLSWLEQITYRNGNIPMFNDSAYDIAPSSKELFNYAIQIGVESKIVPLSDSGYRVVKNDNYEFIIDLGDIGPDYQVGHAHADTLSFELYVKNKPIIVDVGISTYEKNSTRQNERSTDSHNTVMIGGNSQSQIWGGFRVANRAKIIERVEKLNYLEATHNGYKKIGLLHTRSVLFDSGKIRINDVISKKTSLEQVSYFHFHPDIKNIEVDKETISLTDEAISLNFANARKVVLDKYKFASGFNKTEVAYKLKVYFCRTLETTIHI